jgi:F0F1-type ATP synthase assembly protein I
VVEQYDITLNTGFKGAKSRTKRRSQESTDAWYYLGLAGQIGYVVAIPVAGGAILGSLVDKKFGFYPTGTALGLGIGLVLSIMGFVRVIQQVLQQKK